MNSMEMILHYVIFLMFPLIIITLLISYPLMKKKKKLQPIITNTSSDQYKKKLLLPPGSMGWPYIGETFQLYSQDPNIFFTTKQMRYGEIFKTHILGCRCIMLASPEAARFVLLTHAHLFKPTYPKSKEKLIGPSALFFHQGDYHTLIRKTIQSCLSPESIKRKIPDIETLVLSSLDSWAATSGKIINTFHEMKKLSLDVGILSIFGHLDDRYKQILKENYYIVNKGYNSFPTTLLPGTPYHKAILARNRLGEILGEIISERRSSAGGDDEEEIRREKEGDLLDQLLIKCRILLTEEQVIDNIIGVLFAAQDTTASALTWILLYLHLHPKLLHSVKAEQMEIFKQNDEGKRPLSWTQTRNMPFTHRVILESLRMASVISFTFREAVTDVNYKGYVIPKGWKVMPLFRNIHHNPEFFPDPERFDPSRFEVPPRPNTFMPFGNGVHTCPGNELAKLEMFILIHHLVTKFRWEVIGGQRGTQYSPFPVPLNGLPARYWKLDVSSTRCEEQCT